MPKELNLSANERIDLEDFQYGTRTFPVDSLRAHVQRLITGGYRGGFVLEGFRVEIPTTLTDMTVTVYNGVALDRGGRLITYEEGNLFLNNPKTPAQTVPLLDTALKNYVMVEFTLVDSDNDQRAFWDPTYPNNPIKDSGADDVPQPKGKEFTVTIPTRKAQSWSVIVSATGFEDATDPNKLRIPVAIIPINTGINAIDLSIATDTELAKTTIIEQPVIGTAVTDTLGYIKCANTRLFPGAGGTFQLINPVDNSVRVLQPDNTLDIVNNDRDNNILYVKSDTYVNSGIQYTAAPRVGDIVRLTSTGENFLKSGNQYDCRPMLFSFTDDVASTSELSDPFTIGGALTADRYTESRNNKYWAGASLLTDPSTAGDVSVNYPLTNYGQQKGVLIPANRAENRLKQQQDFFRGLCAIVQEVKYGLPYNVDGTSSEGEATSSTSTTGTLYNLGIRNVATRTYIVDTTKYFSQSLVGNYVRGTDSAAVANYGERRIITEVIGEHVLVTNAWPAAWGAAEAYRVEVNYPNTEDATLRKQFVDTRYTGSLEEVYDGRVDQFTGSYSEDLNRRFSANKVATITVGDGINTHGDFTGGVGIRAAFALAYDKKRGAHIHIKRGTYYVPADGSAGVIKIGPNTTVTGEGKGATIIKLLGSGTDVTSTPNYFLIRDYFDNCNSASTKSYDDIVCRNIKFKDLTLESADQTTTLDGKGVATWAVGVGYPLISNSRLSAYSDPLNFAPAGTNPEDAIWLPYSSADVTPSLIDNFSLENVHLIGGGTGDWSTGYDTTYSVYLVAAEESFTRSINKYIEFTGCTFDTHRGGTAVLRGCRNVKISECTFRNADPTSLVTAGGSMAPLEGVTFCSRADALNVSVAYEAGLENSDGEVLISNCIFEGRLYRTAVDTRYPYDGRGWINFTPNYLGQDINITGCNFRGDLTGTNALHTTSWRERKWGDPNPSGIGAVGIVNCSPFNIGISNCEFHTMRYGIITQLGFAAIDSCNFWNCEAAVTVRPEISADRYNYARLSGYIDGTPTWWAGTHIGNFWNAATNTSYAAYYLQVTTITPPGTYFKTRVSNCSFMKGTKAIDVGFVAWNGALAAISSVFPLADFRSEIDVSSCSFNEQSDSAISFYDCNRDTQTPLLSPMTAAFYKNWENISIDSCKFTSTLASIKFYGKLSELINNQTTAYSNSDHKLPIRNIVYTNNEHEWCEYDGKSYAGDATNPVNTNAGALAFIVGERVTVQGNVFKDCYNINGTPHDVPGVGVVSNYEISPVVFTLVGADGAVIVDNVWEHCAPSSDAQISTALRVGLAGAEFDSTSGASALSYNEGPLIKICGNEIDGRSERGVHNGVYISQAYPESALNITGLARTLQAANSGVLDLGPHIKPKLEFKDNSFKLFDANFGLVCVQHSQYGGTATAGSFLVNGGYSNFWEWYSADVTNNRIELNNKTITGKLGNRQYGNDIGTNLTTNAFTLTNGAGVPRTFAAATSRYSFLGSANTTNATKYQACVDLRRCFRGNTAAYFAGYDPNWGSTVNVLNNNFSMLSDPTGVTGAKDVQEIIGFRISKFPREINVKGNTFNRGSLYIKWSWMCPYHVNSHPESQGEFAGSAITITENSFYNYENGVTVDVNPATGFGNGLTTNVHTGAGFLQLVFSNNTVRGLELAAPSAANWDTWDGAIRFWHPALESWGQSGAAPAGNLWTIGVGVGGFHVNQDNALYLWKVEHNYLQDIYFRITESRAGAAGTAISFGVGELGYIPDQSITTNAATWQHNTWLLSEGSSTGSPAAQFSIFGLNCTLGPFPPTTILSPGPGLAPLVSPGGYHNRMWESEYAVPASPDTANRIQINFNYGVVSGLIVKALMANGFGGDIIG